MYSASCSAVEHAREQRSAACVLIDNLPRRFGHAATDRQLAYLSAEEVAAARATNPLEGAAAQVAAMGGDSPSLPQLAERFEGFRAMAEEAFDQASAEAKIESRDHMVAMSRAPEVRPEPEPGTSPELDGEKGEGRPAVMRKHMTSVIGETLSRHPAAVYLGEDVEHGGYCARHI